VKKRCFIISKRGLWESLSSPAQNVKIATMHLISVALLLTAWLVPTRSCSQPAFSYSHVAPRPLCLRQFRDSLCGATYKAVVRSGVGHSALPTAPSALNAEFLYGTLTGDAVRLPKWGGVGRRLSTALCASRRERERTGEKKPSRRERERVAQEQEHEQEQKGDTVGAVGQLAREAGQESVAIVSFASDEPSPTDTTHSVNAAGVEDEEDADDFDDIDDIGIDVTRGTGGKGTWTKLYGDTLPPWLVERLEVCGFLEPTAVQAQTIDTVVCKSRDALVQAYTGSGKSLSFLIPLFAVLEQVRGMDKTKRRLAGVQAVVVAPTRELAMQLTKVARQLAAGCPDTALYVMSVSSDAKAKRQRIWLKADPPQVVIGDPESLLKLCEAGTMRTGSIRFLVVDEVDACFNSAKTKQDLNRLLSRFLTTRKTMGDIEERRTIFASATVREHAHFLQMCEKNKWLNNPVHVYVDPNIKVPPSLVHTFVTTPTETRESIILDLCLAAAQDSVDGRGGVGLLPSASGEGAVILVFADETRESWDGLEARLREGLGDDKLMVLEANIGSAARTRMMKRFREQRGHRVLLASDVATRGL